MNVLAALNKAIDKAGGTQIAFAKLHGISTAYVNDVLQGRREAGQKILDALGLESSKTIHRKSTRKPREE